MKERHWISLITSLQHGQCVLVLGPEIAAHPAAGGEAGVVAEPISYTEALTRRLAAELEDDDRHVAGTTLAAVAQQYEDANGFGANALRALAEKFYTSGTYLPSDEHDALAVLPF